MKKLTALIIATASTSVWAHPGHGTTDPSSARHYLLEPLHIVVLVSVVVAVVAIWGRAKARSHHRD